jgi:hypothetical protein
LKEAALATTEQGTREAAQARAQQEATRVRWDDSHMKSSYANVCNVASTREEVVLLFGTNQAWHAGQREIPVQLTDRVIMSPHAAKRLSILLQNVLTEYETRYGKLPDPRSQQ